MNPKPPAPTNSNGTAGHANGSMRIGPFWKRASDPLPGGGDEPFDALTDLFLGEIGGARGAACTGKARVASEPSTSEDGPVLRLAGMEDQYQLAPPATAISATPDGDVPTHPASPVLMLEDDRGEAVPITMIDPPHARDPAMELMVLGNLPALAGAWASQYVRETAEQVGKPVAYLRVQGAFVGLDLVGALADIAASPTPEDLGSLDDAIDAAAEITDRWIIRCDSGQEGVVAGSAITRFVTILTGTDRAACEACKLSLASLNTRLPGPGEGSPKIRLALMGVGTAEGRAAGAELGESAREALSRPVATTVCASRIGGVRPAHTLFSGSTELTLRTIVRSVERALRSDPIGAGAFAAVPHHAIELDAPATLKPGLVDRVAEEMEAESATDTAGTGGLSLPGHIDASSVIGSADLPLPEPTPTTAEIAAGFSPIAARDGATATPSVVNSPGAEPPAAAPVSASIDSLAGHLANLRSVALRCPYAEGIEIAVDGAGAMHLLVRSGSDSTDDSTLASLLVASSWAEAHASILGPAAGVAPDRRPTLHLFTDRPKKSRRLLETNLRVHLLAPVQVGGQTGWYCTDLN
jgi:hypothetical protein